MLQKILFSDQIKEEEMGRSCSTHGRDEECIKYLVEKLEGNRPRGRPRWRWEDNIRMDHREIRWEGVYWMHLAQDMYPWQALVNTVTNLWVPFKGGKFLD
jgi:hypothetical protein